MVEEQPNPDSKSDVEIMDEVSKNPEFQAETAKLFNERVRLAIVYVAIPITALYILLDYAFSLIPLAQSLPTRITVISILIGIAVHLNKNKQSTKINYVALYIGVTAAVAMTNISVITLTSNWLYQIIASYVQLFLGAVIFLLWPSLRSMTVMFFYILLAIFLIRPWAQTELTLFELQLHIGTIVTFYLTAFFLNRSNISIRKREFIIRKKLEVEIQNRSKIIEQKVSEISHKERELNFTKAEADTMRKVSEVTFRVAHDIRSPLTALNLAVSTISGANQTQKQLITGAIRRISDIASNLLSEKRKQQNQLAATSTFVTLAVEKVVSEKRLIHSGTHLGQIRYEVANDAYSAHVMCNPVLLESTVSNLIENAFDASINTNSDIQVLQSIEGTYLKIVIRDSGLGIEPLVLSRLGKEGLTTKGQKGTGIGLMSAFDFANKCGGRIEIKSKVGQGTEVSLILPFEPPPNWIASSIDLRTIETAVVIDDDPSIHRLWASRLSNYGIKLISYSSPEAIEAELSSLPLDSLFLVDFHFSNSPRSGIEIIKMLPTSARIYLVTSEHEAVLKTFLTLQNGHPIIPKSLVSLTPIAAEL